MSESTGCPVVVVYGRTFVCPYVIPEQFLRHLGDCRRKIPESSIRRGGGVSFKFHIGRPLSIALWQDVYERLMSTSISVLGPGFGEEKTIGILFGPHCSIYLDDDWLVSDIYWTPG